MTAMKTLCLLIGLSVLISACAPAATSTSTASASTNPLTPGDVYVLKGSDQNGQVFEGRLTLSKVATQYNPPYYYIDADNGFLVASSGGVIEQAWLEQGESEVVCVPYIGEARLPYRGRALRGSDDEIKALLNRFRGSDSSYYGSSSCVISKP